MRKGDRRGGGRGTERNMLCSQQYRSAIGDLRGVWGGMLTLTQTPREATPPSPLSRQRQKTREALSPGVVDEGDARRVIALPRPCLGSGQGAPRVWALCRTGARSAFLAALAATVLAVAQGVARPDAVRRELLKGVYCGGQGSKARARACTKRVGTTEGGGPAPECTTLDQTHTCARRFWDAPTDHR